nr:equilibrative nucleobase transporter 1-like [Lytechinus pictus]
MAFITTKTAVLSFAVLENFFHSAIIFGWPSLVYVLKDLGYYSNLCPPPENNTTTTVSGLPSMSPITIISTSMTTARLDDSVDEGVVECDAQDARLLLIYTISSSILPCSMLFSGILFEKGGTLIIRIIFSVSLFVAYLCVAASSPSVPDLLFPGTILMAVTGIFITISTFEVSNLFPKYKSTVIGLIVGSCDSSACVLLFIKVLYDAGVSMRASFLALAISTLFFTVNTLLLPRNHIPWPLPEDYQLRTGCCYKNKDRNPEKPIQNSDHHMDELKSATEMKENNNKHVTVDGDEMSPECYSNLNENNINSSDDQHERKEGGKASLAKDNGVYEKHDDMVLWHDNAGYEHEDGYVTQIPETDNKGSIQGLSNGTSVDLSKAARRATRDKLTEDQRLEDYPTTWSILKSPMFLLMTFWTIVVQGEIFFVIGIMNPWLTFLADGDTETVSFYTNILAITTIGSLIGSPIMGYVFDRRKELSEKSPKKDDTKGPYADLRDSWLPVALSSVTAIAMSGLMMVPILPVQFGTFILLTAVRAMFYSASAAIVPITFPMQFYPTVFGTANFIAGLMSLTQYPLFIVIQESLNGDPRWIIFGMMLANIIALIYPLYIYIYGKNHEKQYLETRREIPTTNDFVACHKKEEEFDDIP